MYLVVQNAAYAYAWNFMAWHSKATKFILGFLVLRMYEY